MENNKYYIITEEYGKQGPFDSYKEAHFRANVQEFGDVVYVTSDGIVLEANKSYF